MSNYLIVGAGFAGAVTGRCLAEAGHHVKIIERRQHLGGNAFDFLNEHQERIHAYGPHLLHGEKDSVAIKWLSRFTDWVPYEHRVRALLEGGKTTPLPVNLTTIEDIFGLGFGSEEEAKKFMAEKVKKLVPQNTDEVFLSSVGEELADIFFRPYTRKMWGTSPTNLEAAVGARIPMRYNRDDRYFSDEFQALPKDGYTKLFERIFDHPLIKVSLGTHFEDCLSAHHEHVFNSMAIDEYYQFRYGKLPYRSIRFKTTAKPDSQAAPVINFTDDKKYTRSTQWDLLPNSESRQDELHTTTIEEPCDPEENNNECYYPVRNEASLNLYDRYKALADKNDKLTFIGRTGLFRYLDMVPCVSIHLQIASKFLQTEASAQEKNA